jgi:hypothetical protein
MFGGFMQLLRPALIAITLAVLVTAPLLGVRSPSSQAPSAYADARLHGTSGERLYRSGNDNSNNNGNSNKNENGNNNGNDNSNSNSNGNRNGNGNDNAPRRRVVRQQSNESVNRRTKCFDAREVGVVQLGTGSYDVTVQVMPHSSFNQTTRLTLNDLNPGSQPAVSGGTLVDSVVFELRAQSSCDGAPIGTLPNLVNMGITYNVTSTVDKAKLRIVWLDGGSWANVDTVPDPVPGNPYVSATINMAGTYALIQVP